MGHCDEPKHVNVDTCFSPQYKLPPHPQQLRNLMIDWTQNVQTMPAYSKASVIYQFHQNHFRQKFVNNYLKTLKKISHFLPLTRKFLEIQMFSFDVCNHL